MHIMDERGQTSTEYLILTAIGVLLAVLAYAAVVTVTKYADDTAAAIDQYRRRLLVLLRG